MHSMLAIFMWPCLVMGVGFYLRLFRSCDERLVPLSTRAWQRAAQQCGRGTLVTSLEQREHHDPEMTGWLRLSGTSGDPLVQAPCSSRVS